ncbi:hypothetical protein [Caulobacter vibrioides]|uniref:Tail tubular protein B n=1 Tax=Caulobacter phage S2B TaxID=2759120 RepID=A0AAE7MLE4_9CAUD|nr:hypothetical protein [Caulobacter vibrioides]QOC54138.1 hypothetical protein [Caulobacter phage S2B]QXZ50188.1 hypothetical protein KZH45_09655 [Caulobacter vibrioides]
MGLHTDSLPSLYNGVSQQSPLVRSKDQLEKMENGWASLATGLGKRAPTEHIARLMPTAPAKALVHEINRDATERYIVVAADGVLRVFDLAGNEKSVTAPAGWGYLAGITDYAQDVSMTTVADYTFVVNRRVICQMDPVAADEVADPSYYIWLNRQTGLDALNNPFSAGAAYQYPVNPATAALKGTVQRFDKLPASPTEGDIYRVTGDDSSNFVSYYVRRTGGVWDETVKPGLQNALNAATLPHALVRQSDGSFTFAPFSWAPRRVGDETTNPNPGFIGRSIRKVFFYQNCLAFLYDENAVLSVAGDFGNFWRMTVLDYLDSDVKDVAATSTKVSILYDAIPFSDGILLTSDQTQFSMTNGEAGISATSIAIRPVTSYEVNTRAGLAAIGSEVYFATESSGWASIQEYSRVTGGESTTAADVTAHVPNYLPAGVHRLIPAGDRKALFVLTDGEPSRAYAYQFYWVSDAEKAQSAWHWWDFGAGTRVLAGAYVGGFLYVVIDRGDGVYLERMNLQAGAKPAGASAQVYLDRRVVVTGQYDAGQNRTTFVLPYAPDKANFRLVLGDAYTLRPLSLVDPSSYSWYNATTLWVPGPLTAGPVIGGLRYTLRLQFSQQYARRGDGSAITTGRLQLRTWTVSYRDTGFFRTEVAPYGQDVTVGEVIPGKVADFSGKIVGAADLILNKPVFHTGKYRFQVYGDATQATITITNDTHVGSTFLAAEWEAFYWNRASA